MNIKLGDLCIIQAGGTPSRSKQEYWNNGEIPWVKIGDIESKYLNKTSEFITVEGLKNSSAKKIERGSILYTIFATLGEVCITNIDVTTNQAIAGIILKDDKVYIDYLYYYLKSLKNHVNSIGRGVAQNNINLTLLRGFEVPIPDKGRQLIIAQSLSNIEKILNNKKQQLSEYNQLIKSRFIEMFGDVLKNDKNFSTCPFGDFVNQMNIGPFGSDLKNDCFVTKENGYCMVYEQKHAIDKKMDVETRYITEDKYNHLKRFDVVPKDILVSCRGTIGECYIIPDDAPHGIIHPSLMMIKVKDTVNNEFIKFLLEHILDEQQEIGSGVKMAIRATELAKINTINPERTMQDEFISFVHLIDKSKFEVQKSLNETQTLFDALMQEYFG